MQISRQVFNKLVEITKKHKPNEASAMLFDSNTIVEEMINDEQTGAHFVSNDEAQLELIEKHGIPSALFHSHPCSAVPSAMDILYMKTTCPGYNCIWLIMSNTMNLRAWTLHNGIPSEIEVNIR